MAASLHDVAQMAGVSISTASRALNRPEMVNEATRERVQAAANALGYIPQGAGRALVSRRTQTVGAVVPRIGVSAFSDTVEALRQGLGKANYTLLLAQPPAQKQTDPRPLRTLIERGVDAIVLLESTYPETWKTLIKQNGLPVVSIWSDSTIKEPGMIGFDNYLTGKIAAQHLLTLGHRRFAFIGGRLDVNIRARRRYRGVLETIAAAGAYLPKRAIIETDYGFQQGYDAAEQLLNTKEMFSALICGNDYLALGAMSYLQGQGLNIPNDISVIGFNNSDFAKFTQPTLTTVHFPSADIGKLAAKALMQVLVDKTHLPLAKILPTPLVKRGSTGPWKK